MASNGNSANKVPTIVAVSVFIVHLSAFLVVTVLLFRHIQNLEQKLLDRRTEIEELALSCTGGGKDRLTALSRLERSLEDVIGKQVYFKHSKEKRQTSSASTLLSSLLQAQEEKIRQQCSGNVKICMSGSKGEQGYKGSIGSKGDKGQPGIRGPDGDIGKTGTKGNPGSTGDTGPKGSIGIKGQKGQIGLRGDPGLIGPKGLTGPEGNNGTKGENGRKGESGDKGATGPKGAKGQKGEPGLKGETGLSGFMGENGDIGPQGKPAILTGPECRCLHSRQLPIIVNGTSSVSGSLGQDIDLVCNATGNPKPYVLWYKEHGCNVNKTSGQILHIGSLKPSDLGEYICVASNINGNASRTISVTSPGLPDPLDVFDCDFENSAETLCKWSQSNDDNTDLNSHRGPTLTPDTGPFGDHTTGSGTYLYIEASLTNQNDSARIESMRVSVDETTCFTAWYNMFGKSIGSLNVYKKACDGNIVSLWSMSGDQGRNWQKMSVQIPPDPEGLQLVIETLDGNSVYGDIAMDDLHLSKGPCNVFVGGSNSSITSLLGSYKLLHCDATGNPKPSITWNKTTSCSRLSHSGTSLLINQTTFSDGGVYTCTATNSGDSSTKEIHLTVEGKSTCDLETHKLCGWSHDTTNTSYTWLLHSGNTPTDNTGPTYDHTKGTNNGTYLFLETSGKSPLDKVVLKSPTLPGKTDVCLRFWYNMNGDNIGSLNVYAKTCTGVKKTLLQLSGNHDDVWFEKCLKFTPLEHEFNLLIEGVVGNGYHGDIGIDDIEIMTGRKCTCSVRTISSCSFESGLCQWTQDILHDDFDWDIHAGPTLSSATGPSADHTTGSGKYIYTEGSGPQSSGDKAMLISPPLQAGQSYCLNFAYHMYGHHMGTLNIYTRTYVSDTRIHDLYTLSGDKGNTWYTDHVLIKPETETFNVVLEGVIGPAYSSDLALDDLQITTGTCSST